MRGLLGARSFCPISFLWRPVWASDLRHAFFADEVGLGKTIEAGLILTQQLQRQRANRVLVIVPDTLAHQWLVEMQRRFHLSFSLFNRARLEEADIEAEFSENPLIIAPISLFEDSVSISNIVSSLSWDMAVIDEAQHITGSGENRSELGQFCP